MNDEAYELIGSLRFGGVLIVADHASNRIPADIDLGIAPELLGQHIAFDIGVATIARIMAAREGTAAFLAQVSRLVCDFNRDEDDPAVIPASSDGHTIPGNRLTPAARAARRARFHQPYHAALAALIESAPQALIVSLHSFTPRLASDPAEQRPWHVGVLYNDDDRAARLAIPLLEAEGLCVGDQQPYSGKVLNATMNRHAEADGRPYLGLELRQDLVADDAAQREWATRLTRIANQVALAFCE